MSRSRTHLAVTGSALAAVAVVGGLGTHPNGAWYRSLRKPPWQPPDAAFGPVWTLLYTLIAVAGARVLDRRTDAAERRRFGVALAVNLVLNTAFSWIYFTGERQRAALVNEIALDISTAGLIREAARTDRAAAWLLVPYLVWNVFATVLTAAVIRRNPGRR